MSLLLSLALSSVMTRTAVLPPTISADFHEVANYKVFSKAFAMTDAHRAMLRKNGFFTCPSKDEALYWAYGTNDYLNVPSFLTTDNLLQIYHVFFDSTLRTAEQSRMLPDVVSITNAMAKQSLATLAAVKGSQLEGPARKNAAYFGVACALAGQKIELPADIKTMVDGELALIDGHDGFAKGLIFPYEFDYSQFIVRGHYTRSPQLTRYFRTMMWYGLVPFAVEISENGAPPRPATEQIQQALLMSHDLDLSGAAAKWQKLYDVTSLFAGRANSPTPPEWDAAAKRTFGEGVSGYKDQAKLAEFLNVIRKTHPPLIMAKRTKGSTAGPVQFRFMGQRAIPDSYIMQELSDPDKRPFPSPLDILAVLGSQRALQLLDGNPTNFATRAWSEYAPTRASLRSQFDAVPAAGWNRDLYWSWLNTLKPMINPLPAAAPAVLRTNAWMDKSLASALGSWAELRHDTILYGLQSVAEMGDGGDEQPYVKGYVEPNVELYTRLDGMVRQIRDAMKSRGYLDGDTGTQFVQFLEVIQFFKHVAQNEIAGKPITKAEHWRIRKIEGELETLHNRIQVINANYQQLTEDELFIALVADVHTARGQALEVGVGAADRLVVAVPIEGKTYLAQGTQFSYYEFKQPISDRLTDEKWKATLRAGKAPARPFWTSSFFVPTPLKDKE